MTKQKWLRCLCGKDVYILDMPEHFRSKHERFGITPGQTQGAEEGAANSRGSQETPV